VTRALITGNASAAWGARLAAVDYVPAFPITPQTEIIETLAGWVDSGDVDMKTVTLESEHSMITAAGAAAVTGVRVFTATSSQGLLYAMEMLYAVAGWRAPFVLVNVSRALAAPITLEPDHNDVLATRDTGFMQFHAATCQEALDFVLLAYRAAEDRRVRLPAIVNFDGFYLSFTREPVDIPDAESAGRFLPPFDPGEVRLRASAPISHAIAVMGGGPYSYFRYETHLALMNAAKAFDDAAVEFERIFKRKYERVESYRADDADYLFVMMGAFATKAKDAVDALRKQGHKAGLLRPRLLRPFPGDLLQEAIAGKRAVAVIDQNISMGSGGVLHTELASALYRRPGAPPLLSFIGGLGGRDIGMGEFLEMARQMVEAASTGRVPLPRLLYTASELRELRKLQTIANAERGRVAGGDKRG
jgi:pyruvate ferredoxin oxidoreductase alpha subunit